MNSRQFAFIVVFAVVLAAVGWILFHRGARSWESQPTSGDTKIVEFPLNDVAHIAIKDGTSELNLVRKEDGWVVRERTDYPANFEQVSRLLQKIWNLKPVQTLQVGPSQLGRFDLVEPANGAKGGTLFELKDKAGEKSVDLYFGPKAPQGHEGRWIQTNPGKGWFTYFRIYGPEQAAFDGTWKPGDFEEVK